MEDKKDIGSFFKEKLKEGKKSPDKNLWNKIDTSLDELAKRKKSNLRYWLAGFGIPILLGLFLLFNPSKEDVNSLEISDKNSSNELPVPSLNKMTDENDKTISLMDSLEQANNSVEKNIEITSKTENSTKEELRNPSEIVPQNKIKKSSAKSSGIDETYTVTKKYYYYNSEDDKELVTTNKNKIDSLLSDKKKMVDSSLTKKKDSLVE